MKYFLLLLVFIQFLVLLTCKYVNTGRFLTCNKFFTSWIEVVITNASGFVNL